MERARGTACLTQATAKLAAWTRQGIANQKSLSKEEGCCALPRNQRGLSLSSSRKLWSLAGRMKTRTCCLLNMQSVGYRFSPHTEHLLGFLHRVLLNYVWAPAHQMRPKASRTAEVRAREWLGHTRHTGHQPTADWRVIVESCWTHVSKPVQKKRNAKLECPSVRNQSSCTGAYKLKGLKIPFNFSSLSQGSSQVMKKQLEGWW